MSQSETANSPSPPASAPDSNRVKIFDTTLRDGEQSPGCSMVMARKNRSRPRARRTRRRRDRSRFSDRLAGDFEAVRAIAAEVTGASVCGLARCNDRDIDRAWEAIRYAQKPRIHVFLATSAIHREHKLRDDARPRSSRRRLRAFAGPKGTATTSSSAPKTQPAPRSTSSARSSRPRSKPAPPP